MVPSLSPDHPLRRLFCGTVQHALYVDVGLCDPQLVDYLTDLLSTFIHRDDFFPFRDMAGRPLEDLARLATDAHFDPPLRQVEREKMIHKHIGDFALFWSGLFPEGLRRLQRMGVSPNPLEDYLSQGKRSYAIASKLSGCEDRPPAGVLERLSDRFEYCVYGLSVCRQHWLKMQPKAG